MDMATRALPLPRSRRSPVVFAGFAWYVRRYLRKHFHAVRLAGDLPGDAAPGPLVVVMNHPSWWDPLVGLILTQLFPGREPYAPIESAALEKYRFFERLGFFGIDPGTPAGGLAFLRTATQILARPQTALWVTAQGGFTDPRERPVRLRAGIGHLMRRLDGGTVLPLALEYPFWSERFPEALARFGAPIAIGRGVDRSVEDWMERIETGLTQTQDALAAWAKKRDASPFRTLIGGVEGVGGIYDLWRRSRAWLRGERFHAAHSQPIEGVP
jgi:1-acyl-sn-glycerol-3-phosphate acyltransferase